MGEITPPKLPLKLLKWFCKPAFHPDIEGDLLEFYERRVNTLGPARAGRLLYKDVFLLFRPGIIRSFRHTRLFHPFFMIKDNLKIAFRQMLKQKGFAAIKIGGFALGMMAFLLIVLFIKDEWSYDKQYPDLDRIYRVYIEYNFKDNTISGASHPPPLAATIAEEFPEVEATARFNAWPDLNGPGTNQFRRADREENSYEEGFIYADQSLLDIFQFPFLHGDASTALSEPNTIILTEEKAKKYFPGENPLGKTVILNDDVEHPFEVSGVLADNGAKSHIDYDFFLSMAGHEFWPGEQQLWNVNFYDCYLKLKPNVDAAAFEKKLESIVRKYYAPIVVELGQAESVEAFTAMCHLRLQPVDEVYLNSAAAGIGDNLNHGDIRLLRFLGVIAIFILVLAAINFINLSTARSANRAREVGLRKVLGSLRRTFINQFLTESLLYATLAFVLGVLAMVFLLPVFNQMVAKSITIPWSESWFIPSLLLLMVITGIAAGIYPALYLSGFRPMETLKGKLALGAKGSGLQNTLVVFQFTITIVLIASTMLIHRQMNFILNKDLGFEKDQVLLLQGVQTLEERVHTLKENLLQLPEVKHVSVSDFIPVKGGKRSGNMMFEVDRKDEAQQIVVQRWRVDHDYTRTMGLHLVEGRDFNREMPSDSQATIVNQRLVEEMNLQNPIGAVISNNYSDPVKIIGVVEDFHFESFREEIAPLCLILDDRYSETISIKVSPDQINSLLPALTALWDRFAPNQPIRYSFLDDRFAAAYEDVKRMGWIISGFSILAILLACLGLFALAAFMAEQRSKEMSIRKVLGTSVTTIFRLLTQNFLILVLIAMSIATPISWYFMQRWLEDYNYRIDITPDVFIVAGVLVLLIALLTISYQAIKAAVMNPARVMKKD